MQAEASKEAAVEKSQRMGKRRLERKRQHLRAIGLDLPGELRQQWKDRKGGDRHGRAGSMATHHLVDSVLQGYQDGVAPPMYSVPVSSGRSSPQYSDDSSFEGEGGSYTSPMAGREEPKAQAVGYLSVDPSTDMRSSSSATRVSRLEDDGMEGGGGAMGAGGSEDVPVEQLIDAFFPQLSETKWVPLTGRAA